MAYLSTDKIFSKQWIYDYTMILIGTFVMAAGFVFFIDPHKIVPGGVYGIAIVVNDLTQGLFPNGLFGLFVETFHKYNDGLPIGLVSWLINIPLLILGVKILGPRFGFKTIVGFSACSYFIDFLTSIWGMTPLAPDVLLSCVFGGILIGFGLALIFKARGTTAGSDIIAMIIAKYTKMSLGQLIIYIDSMIVLLALIAFKDWQIPLYSWIVIYITGKVIDITMQGGSNYNKALIIISDKHIEIRNKLLNDLERGGTYLNGEGMYNGSAKKIIYTVVTRREFSLLKSYVLEVDPNAFISISNASEILGEGFKSLEQSVSEEN